MSFTLMRQSLQSLGADVTNGSAFSGAKKHRPNKKRSKKPKTEANGDATTPAAGVASTVDLVDEYSSDWQPVVSKKSKARENGATTTTASNKPAAPRVPIPKVESLPTVTVDDAPSPTEAEPSPQTNGKRKHRRKNNKAKSNGVEEPTPAPTVSEKPEPQQPSVKEAPHTPAMPSNAAAAAPTTTNTTTDKSPSSMSTETKNEWMRYTSALECLVAEALSSQEVQFTRERFPTLRFSEPPPKCDVAVSEKESPNLTIVRLKAIVAANQKQFEMVTRSLVNQMIPPPLQIEEVAPVKPMTKTQVEAKEVQCSILSSSNASAPVAESKPKKRVAVETPTPAARAPAQQTAATPVIDPIHAALQEEIANNAKRITLLSSHNETLQKQLKKQASEHAKEKAELLRSKEEAFSREMAKKTEEIARLGKKLETLELEHNERSITLERLRQENHELAGLKQLAESRATELSQHQSALQEELNTARSEQAASAQQAEALRSELEALQPRLADAEELTASRARVAQLETRVAELETAAADAQELAASQALVAHLQTRLADAEAAAANAGRAAATADSELQALRSECGLLKEQLEEAREAAAAVAGAAASEKEEVEENEKTSVDGESVEVLVGQVAHYRRTLAATEEQLSRLEALVTNEVATWKSTQLENDKLRKELEGLESSSSSPGGDSSRINGNAEEIDA